MYENDTAEPGADNDTAVADFHGLIGRTIFFVYGYECMEKKLQL